MLMFDKSVVASRAYESLFIFNYSNPTPMGKEDPTLAVSWDPVSTPYQLPYLDISNRLELKRNPEPLRMEFWDELYQQYNGDFM